MGIKKNKDDEPTFDLFTGTFVTTKSRKPISKNTRNEPTSVVDFMKARFEANPEMDPEEYKRWIKILVNASLKRL